MCDNAKDRSGTDRTMVLASSMVCIDNILTKPTLLLYIDYHHCFYCSTSVVEQQFVRMVQKLLLFFHANIFAFVANARKLRLIIVLFVAKQFLVFLASFQLEKKKKKKKKKKLSYGATIKCLIDWLVGAGISNEQQNKGFK